jgi:hypothetical protein
MQLKTYGDSRRLYRIVANVGVVIAALWLLAYLIPPCRSIMLDMVLAFILGLMATGLLWWAAYLSSPPRRFWGVLAAAWSVNLLGDLAWGLYEQISGNPLPFISLIDLVYLVRYALVFFAFWQGFHLPRGRRWLWLLGSLVMATAVVIGAYFLSVPASRRTVQWMAGAIYPILDIGILYVALEAWKGEPRGSLKNALAILALALFSYGAANWVNFFGLAIPVGAVAGLAGLFWPLSDILAGTAVLHLLWAATIPEVSLEKWER